jgi:hypothetical protein
MATAARIVVLWDDPAMTSVRLVVEFSERDVSVSGTRDELAGLAAIVASGSGEVELPPEAASMAGASAAHAIRIVVADEAGMAITRDGDALVITGDPAALNVFSGNIKKFADTPEWGSHIHVEHYEGHPHIRAASIPAVISATDPA